MAEARKPGERKQNPSKGETKLAQQRIKHGVTQEELAQATGMSIRAIQQLERREIRNPRIRGLVNLSTALGVSLKAICEDEWFEPIKLGKWQVRPDERYKPEPVERLPKKPGRFSGSG
jgi:transcriptional regulator with XRE-family HTH domain